MPFQHKLLNFQEENKYVHDMLEIHFLDLALWVSGQSIAPCTEGSQVWFPIKGMCLGWRFHPQP